MRLSFSYWTISLIYSSLRPSLTFPNIFFRHFIQKIEARQPPRQKIPRAINEKVLGEPWMQVRSVFAIYVSFIVYKQIVINCIRFILIVGMWATRMLRTATAFKPMFGVSNPVRNYLSTVKPSFNDCTFMQLKCHSLVSNMFLHNVRELLENAELGEEACSLAEIVELSLLNQSKLIARIILGRMI